MANKIKTAAAKKAKEAGQATKVIRRRNEEGEVVEIEIPDEPVEKAKVEVHVESKDTLLERRKIASDHLAKVTGKSLKDNRLKAALGKGISAIDKALARL